MYYYIILCLLYGTLWDWEITLGQILVEILHFKGLFMGESRDCYDLQGYSYVTDRRLKVSGGFLGGSLQAGVKEHVP